MMGGQSKPPARGQAQPGQDSRLATAAGTSKISQAKGCAKRYGIYEIRHDDGERFKIIAKGPEAWALNCLIEAGVSGCTPFEQPAPHWAAYILNLRGMGVPILTLTETHSGEFPGTHERYALCARVVLRAVALEVAAA